MTIYPTQNFPYVEFGSDPARKVRLLVSPETTGDERCNIVVVTVPPGGVSEAHTHDASDEYIWFDIGGKALIDGVEYGVQEKGMILASKGKPHECTNISKDKDLTLVCFFVPAFAPYGKYPDLIQRTKQFLETQK